MNIALLTFHSENNYGAVLQTYALKSFLEYYGNVTILNYLNPLSSVSSVFSSLDITEQVVLENCYSLLYSLDCTFKSFIQPITRMDKFRTFVNHMCPQNTLVTIQELYDSEGYKDYDVYISGSDQIWNPMLTGMDPVFFLDFVTNNKAKKISYASSTGGYCFSRAEAVSLTRFLKSFDHISVREQDSAMFLSRLLGRKVYCTLDPVFLLSKQEWVEKLRLMENPEPFVLVYNMSANKKYFEIAESLAREIGCGLANIPNWHTIGSIKEYKKYVDIFHIDAGPTDFLNLLLNAQFVITDSFHGTAFSLLFEKPFLSIVPRRSPGRIINILRKLDLTERVVTELEHDCSETIVKKALREIPFNRIKGRLESLRFQSIEFLNQGLVKSSGG